MVVKRLMWASQATTRSKEMARYIYWTFVLQEEAVENKPLFNFERFSYRSNYGSASVNGKTCRFRMQI